MTKNKLGLSRRDSWLLGLAFVVYTAAGLEKARAFTSLGGAILTLGLVYVLFIGAGLLYFYVSGGVLSRRARTLAFSLAACLLLGLSLASLWNGAHDRRIAEELRSNGVEVAAEVIAVRSFEQQAKVVFETEAKVRIETWVTVATSVEKGPTRVRYLRSRPVVARLVDDPVPRNGDLTSLLVVSGFCGLVGLALFFGLRAIDRSLGVR